MYRKEIKNNASWYQNNIALIITRIKELVVDCRKRGGKHKPAFINGAAADMVNSVKFLGIHITAYLIWHLHTDAVVKRTHQ